MEITYDYNILSISTIDTDIQVMEIGNLFDLTSVYDQFDIIIGSKLLDIQNKAFTSFKQDVFGAFVEDTTDKQLVDAIQTTLDLKVLNIIEHPFKNFVSNGIQSLKKEIANSQYLLATSKEKTFPTTTVNVPNFITRVEWELVGTDELGNSAKVFGVSGFSAKDPKINKYPLAFDSITKEQIISWIDSETTSVVRKKFQQQQILNEIQAKRFGEKQADSLPWETK